MKRFVLAAAIVVSVASILGCHNSQPVYMPPPVNTASPMSGPMGGPPMASAPNQGVYQWQDVPVGQQVPVAQASFDQGGYQIQASTGETIMVPFVNNNLNVMMFGRTNGQPYFVNQGNAPILYVSPNFALMNAAAQGARWYPLPADYAYSQPVYVSIAPSWNDYVNMGWYPGMTYYGGMWGYHPYSSFAWMPGFYINLGGRRYTSYVSYHTYYTSHPGYVRTRTYYNYSVPRGTGSFGSSRTGSFGSTGSFGTGRRTGFGNASSSTGSFGTGRSSGFGGANSSTGSFGTGRRTGFGGGSTGSSNSSFGGTGGGSFNSTPRNSGGSSFGGGRSSGSTGGSFFGGGRSSGSSGGSFFGGGRSSGGSSFGGSGRSSGSFGRKR